MRLFRVLVEVDGLDAALAFYATLFGLEGRRVGGGRVYFDCGAVIFGAVDVSGEGRTPEPAPEYVYFSVDDLDAVHQRADVLGCLSSEDVHGVPGGEVARRPWGERSFYARDPYGNRLCFVEAGTEFRGR